MSELGRTFTHTFNLKVHEWPRLLLLYAMVFLFIIGITWGGLSVEAAFLLEVGVENLPRIIVANAIVSIVAVVVYTPFVDRVPHRSLLIAVTLACAVPIVLGRLLLTAERPVLTNAAYQMLYLLTIVVRQVFNLQWWTYVNSFYDTRSAKRIIPVLVTAPRIAIIVAGQTIGLLSAYLAPKNIILLWIGTLLCVPLLAWLMPHLLKEKHESHPRAWAITPGPEHRSFTRNVREGYDFVSQSPYLRWMAFSTLFMMALLALLEFRASEIFTQSTRLGSQEALSGFLGQISAWSSMILLPFQLLLFSRMVSKLGLGNANLIFPLSSLAICAGLIARPGQLSAALAYLNRKDFRRVFRNPINNLLYNAVPLRVKGRARAFIDGLIAPIGSLVGGLLLLLPFAARAWFVPLLITVISVAYAVSAVIVRRQYAHALITLLEEEDYSSLFTSPSDLTITDGTTLDWLTQKLRESDNGDLTIFMTQLISEIGGDDAVPVLAEIIRAANEPYVRAAIIDILTANHARTNVAARIYTAHLNDPNSHVRRSAINALKQWAGPGDERFLVPALDLLQDPDIDVRAQVIPALAQAGDFFYLASAVQALTQLLEAEDAKRRAQGVRVLGQIGDPRFIRNLASYLADEDDQVRLEAIRAIEELAQQTVPETTIEPVMEHIPALEDDPVEGVRQATVAVLAHIDTPQAHTLLTRFLTDAQPRVREAAVEALVDIGAPAVPLLTPALDAEKPLRQKMSTITLSRIDREQFAPHVTARIDEELNVIYENLAHLEGLEAYAHQPSIAVLQSLLREKNARLIDDIFHLLGAIHEPEALDVIAESLASDTPRTRANAIEALESLTTPQMARAIAPLFVASELGAQTLSEAETGEETANGIAQRQTNETIQQLATDDDPWVRMIVTFALGKIGAESRQPLNAKGAATPLSWPKIETLLEDALHDPDSDVRRAARSAQRILSETDVCRDERRGEADVLSAIERIIFLKEVPFFAGMTIEHLKVIANICEEEFFPQETLIFEEGEAGGTMYVVVSGRVAIEREAQRAGSLIRLATVGPRAYFGEMALFDTSQRSAAARTLQDTITLSVRREPLIALARQHPELSLELIHVLSQRLRAANDRIAELTQSKPREIQDLYDTIL